MGETEVSWRSLRRSDRLVENQVEGSAKVVHAEDETEEAAAERRASKRGQSVRRSKRGGKRCEEEVVTGELMGIDVVNAVSVEVGSLKLNDDCNGNSRSSGIVLNAVRQEFVANMERSLARGDNAACAYSSSDDGDEDDTVMDLEGAGEQEEINTALGREDAALLVELTQVIQRGGDWKELTVPYMHAYLRHHGLRMSGVKAILVNRVEEHLKIKDGQGEDIYPRSSFTINCKGDVCLGDTVLFLQTVYNAYDIVKRSAGDPPKGERWVAGKVVNESYGAQKQQDTFTIEVLWSTGTKPLYIMRPLQIKGHNLYRMHTLRQPWIDEEIREQVLSKKYDRVGEPHSGRRYHLNSKDIGGSGSKASSKVPLKAEHLANSSHSMPRQSSIQQDFQQDFQENIFSGSSVAASSPLSHHLPNFVQQGREALVQQQQQQRGGDVSHSSLLSNTFQGQGICHIACSNRNCKKAGAKHCVWQLCAVCCYKNGSSRGSCPRHQ